MEVYYCFQKSVLTQYSYVNLAKCGKKNSTRCSSAQNLLKSLFFRKSRHKLLAQEVHKKWTNDRVINGFLFYFTYFLLFIFVSKRQNFNFEEIFNLRKLTVLQTHSNTAWRSKTLETDQYRISPEDLKKEKKARGKILKSLITVSWVSFV